MPGQRFGYPVGSHYTGVRGVRDYSRHIRSTHKLSSGWRIAAQAYAKNLGKFALRGLGPIGTALAVGEGGYYAYKYLKSQGMFNRGTDRRQTGQHTRKRKYIDPYGYNTARNFGGGGDRTVWATGTQTEMDHSGTGVLRHYKKKTGRYKPFSAKVSALLKCQVAPQIESWRDLTNGYDAGGSKILSLAKADATTDTTFPVHIYELNNLNNKQSGALPGITGTGCWFLKRQDTTGNFYLENLTHQNNDNSGGTYGWEIDFRNGANADNTTPYAYLDWVDIRLMFSGPRKYPCRVKVQLVRFLEEDCCPGMYQTTNVVTVAPTAATIRQDPTSRPDAVSEWNQMWLEYTGALLNNPINTRSQYHNGKKIAVLKSCQFDFQPRDTSDDGPTGGVGDVKVLKWFNRVEKNYKFTEVQDVSTQIDADEQLVPQEGFTTLAPQYTTSPHNKARLFLIISATVPVTNSTAQPVTSTADVYASYDILLRRKWWFNENP